MVETEKPLLPQMADALALAAAPTFALMALLTAVLGNAGADAICSAAHASAFGGMIPMYILMSGFHLSPWLRLVVYWRGGWRET